MAKKKKNKVNVVYSTNPNFSFDFDEDEEQMTLLPQQQNLKILIDRKQRNGKEVTLIQGFIGTNDDVKALGKKLKSKCGVGGSVKDSDILIQGNHAEKILEILLNAGYKVKRKG